MKCNRFFSAIALIFTLMVFVVIVAPLPATGQAVTAQITLLDEKGASILSLTDGDRVRLQVTLPQAIDADIPITFHLQGSELPLASCTIVAQQASCQTETFAALGWYWNADGTPQPERSIDALGNEDTLVVSNNIQVMPRPVVMVHGFSSSWEAWTNYLGPEGYLAEIGVPGYAVGDGQVAGVMNTGSLDAPTRRTNTIAQNAAILGEYIHNVQKVTGAEKVDLFVHSMGGMISRYYIDRLMKNGEVAQLIILGTPMAGTACANLPASLGFYIPAAIEIQPSYMINIFNLQITHRRGVPFHAIAGTQILDAIQSPCTAVPSDIVVSLESMRAIPLKIEQIPLLHVDLNTSRDVFETFVKPLLQTSPGQFPVSEDSVPATNGTAPQQFTGTYSGHLQPGETRSITIAIDPSVTVASFGLYDTSRSLAVTVQGASGKVIELSAGKNGLLTISDPTTLIYLGYGFKNPKPGEWIVTLNTTDHTPASGTDYALGARFEGGARLEAQASPTLPKLGERVSIVANLTNEASGLSIDGAQAKIYTPDGQVNEMVMVVNDTQANLVFRPPTAGVYGIEVHVSATTSDGMVVDRATWLAFEAQPSNLQTLIRRSLFGVSCCGILLVMGVLVWGWIRWRKQRVMVQGGSRDLSRRENHRKAG
jgi:pimeloyl-ACP methyl ester carboxylesterase